MQRNDEVLKVETCDICGDVGYPELLVTCSECNVIHQHCYCMQILLNEVPDVWFCESCQSKNGTTSPCKVNQDAGLQATKRQQTVRTGRLMLMTRKAYLGSKSVTPKIPSLSLKSNPCISPMVHGKRPRNEVQKNQMTDLASHSSSKGPTKEHRLEFERQVCALILDKKAQTLDLHVEKPAKGAPSEAITARKSIAIAGSGAVAECSRSDIEKRIIRVFRKNLNIIENIYPLQFVLGGGRDPTPSTGGKGKEKVNTTRRRRVAPRIIHDAGIYLPMPTTDNPSIPTTQDSPSIPSTPGSPSIAPTQHVHVSGGSGSSNFEHDTTSAVLDDPYHTNNGGTTHSPSSLIDGNEDDVDDSHLHDGFDDEVVQLSDGRVVIRPAGNAFLPSKPSSKAITAVIKEKFQQPWTSWGMIKKNEVDADMMFRAFKEKCIWLPMHEELVEKNFHHRAAHRFSDMLSDMRQSRKRPHWMRVNVWDVLSAHWKSEDYKKICERNKTNRASERGGNLHTGGSVNTAQIRERMERTLRRPVTLHELHHHIHIRKESGKFVDDRSRQVQEDFQKAMTQCLSQAQATSDSSTPTNPADMGRLQLSKWVEVCGGKKKGRVYGAGVLSSCYKRGVSYLDINASSSAASIGRFHTDEAFVEMQRKVADAQHQAQEAKRENEELLSKFNEMAEQQRQMFALLQQQGRPSPPPQTQPCQQYYYGPSPPHSQHQPHHFSFWPSQPQSQHQPSPPPQTQPCQQYYYGPSPPHSQHQPHHYSFWPSQPQSQHQPSPPPPPPPQ